jgi:hypothetical protein
LDRTSSRTYITRQANFILSIIICTTSRHSTAQLGGYARLLGSKSRPRKRPSQ